MKISQFAFVSLAMLIASTTFAAADSNLAQLSKVLTPKTIQTTDNATYTEGFADIKVQVTLANAGAGKVGDLILSTLTALAKDDNFGSKDLAEAMGNDNAIGLESSMDCTKAKAMVTRLAKPAIRSQVKALLDARIPQSRCAIGNVDGDDTAAEFVVVGSDSTGEALVIQITGST